MRALVGCWVVLGLLCAGLAPVAAQQRPPQTIEALKASVASEHPAACYELAKRLFEAGERDEGVFWFYVGQIRFRSRLMSNPSLPRDGEPALFSSLSEVVGTPINRYAFGDIAALAATIDRALAWDAANADRFSRKDGPERARTRQGLAEMKADMLARADEIRATREKNGLENRTR